MLRAPRTDFWQVGIVPSPVQQVSPSSLSALRSQIVWLPPAGDWRYLADPFGLIQGDALHVFVEAYDYRSKHGVIERHEYAADSLRWRGKQTALARRFHLSYPFVFEHQGAVYMVPETHQANEIALYRATGSLDEWERQCALLSGVPGADASLIQHQGRWWMFYAVVGARGQDQRELHVAHASELTGPWQSVRGNPVRSDLASSRPAGRPFVDAGGCVVLPVQDCSGGYGGATRLLRFLQLSVDEVRIEPMAVRLTGDMVCDDHTAGFHTLSACGPLTLIDVKRIDGSRAKHWLDLKRRVKRLATQLRA